MQTSFRISVADDDEGTRDLLREMLTALNHCVVSMAEDGRQLVEHCQQVRPDLVILDLEMPVVDGLAAAEEISASQDVPMILISGHPDAANVVTNHEPIDRLLCKPISLSRLGQAIQDVMAKRAGEAEHN